MKKIAVMLPVGYRGGSLRAAKNIAKSIATEAARKKEKLKVVFSYAENGNYDLYKDFSDLRDCGISLRATEWKVFKRSDFQSLITIANIEPWRLAEHTEYCLPTDGANNFFDCDLWIIISDRLPAPLLPSKKYICIIYDYIQRYVPEIWDNTSSWLNQDARQFSLVRNAEKVFVTTPTTKADMVSYAGVPATNISILEIDFDPLSSIHPNGTKAAFLPLDKKALSNYFIWTTNNSYHKNLINAFDALDAFYNELGGNMNVIITGYGTSYFDPSQEFPDSPQLNLPHIRYIRGKIKDTLSLKKKVHIVGHVNDTIYMNLLQKSKFLWHPTFYDNGTFSVIEAAYFQRPSLSANYPAMKYIDEKFNLNLTLFDPHNTNDMAHSLRTMEEKYSTIFLPKVFDLEKHSWISKSPSLFQAIAKFI